MYPGENKPDCIIVHHSAYAPQIPQAKLINEWHKARGFPLSRLGQYVGYHYIIEPNGLIVQTRDESEGGAHTIGKNWSSIGICMAGDFSTEAPTSAQIYSLTSLMLSILERWPDIKRDQIFPHRRFSQTECYGAHLSDEWAADLIKNVDLATAHPAQGPDDAALDIQ